MGRPVAAIVELSYPDNVTLLQGAMQNWRDLPAKGPAGSAAVERLLDGLEVSGHVLVVGPHPASMIMGLAQRAERLSVVTRAIPDAAEIGTAVPSATVWCGSLTAAAERLEPADVVVALADAALLLSTEEPVADWSSFPQLLHRLAAPGARVLMAIENERGMHRQNVGADLFVRDTDADWTPFATWDQTRPRRTEALPGLDGWPGVQFSAVLPTWETPAVLLDGAATVEDRALAMAYAAGDRRASALTVRSVGLADLALEQAAGWIVRVGVPSPGAVVTPVGPVEGQAPTTGPVQTHFLQAAADHDMPAMRALLRFWWEWLQEKAVDGVVPTGYADARLSNLVAEGGTLRPLRPGDTDLPVDRAAWLALADVMGVITSQGLTHPWPTAMNPQTRFAALLAMAEIPVPDDLGPYAEPQEPTDLSRDALLAVIRRQQNELRIVWSRFHWDEKQYAAYRASKFSRRVVRYAQRNGKQLPAKAKRLPQTLPATAKKLPAKAKKRLGG